MSGNVSAGWYPDPSGGARLRWFDGTTWWADTVAAAPDWYPDPWREAPLRWFDGQQWTGFTRPLPHEISTLLTDTTEQGNQPPATPVVTAEVRPGSPRPAAHVTVRESGVDSGDRGALERLLANAPGVAVVDVETTGLGRLDRIVEIAIVTLDRAGDVKESFHTLINPYRDVGPTSIHGVTASMVSEAPMFADVADAVAERLDGVVIAAHNIAFDTRMLGYELDRVGIGIDWGAGLDTLAVTHGKLAHACHVHGIDLTDSHQALADASATAELLVRIAGQFSGSTCPARAAGVRPHTTPRLLPRGSTSARVAYAPVVALSRDVQPAPDVAPYSLLLDQALADLKLTADERDALRELATDLGLNSSDVARAHRDFLATLIDTALDDDVVTDDELDMLTRVAALLELDPSLVTSRTNSYRSRDALLELTEGLAVCFTGDPAAVDRMLTKDHLRKRAALGGLKPIDDVTKSECRLLVAVDAATSSGKAAKAHKFNIPIATVADFLAALDADRPLPVKTLQTAGVGCVCTQCGDSWTATRSAQTCPGCRGKQTTSAHPRRPEPAAPMSSPGIDVLTCMQCHATWERPRQRGRRPHRCPSCVTAA